MWNSDIRVRKRPIDAVNHRHSRGNSRDFSSQPHIDGELPRGGKGAPKGNSTNDDSNDGSCRVSDAYDGEQVWSWHKALRDNLPIVALMLAMFIIGMVIEPMIPRPEGTLGTALGAIFLVVPILLIAVMVLSSGQRISDEEE